MKIVNCYGGLKGKIFSFIFPKRFFYRYQNKRYKRWILKNFNLDNPPLFSHIQIETTNWCNNNCPFCPVNCYSSKRGPHKIMSLGLIKKIAKELKNLQFEGKLSLYNNNEPLIDKRMPQIIKIFKKNTPLARTTVMTNGILLNEKKLIELYHAGLDNLIVDNYSDDLKLIPSIKKTIDSIKKDQLSLGDMNFKILLRRKNEILSNRAGNAPNKRVIGKHQSFFCVFPFVQLNINPLGQITICCFDAYYENIIGNVKNNKIIDIWRNKKYGEIRQNLLKSRRLVNPCYKCDFEGVYGISEGFKINFSIKDNKIIWRKIPNI